MDLKGGFAYLDMRENDLTTITTSETSIYVEGLYNDAYKIIKSKKVCIMYNIGGTLLNVPVIVESYNTNGSVIYMRYSVLSNTGVGLMRKIYIKPDSTYFVASA